MSGATDTERAGACGRVDSATVLSREVTAPAFRHGIMDGPRGIAKGTLAFTDYRRAGPFGPSRYGLTTTVKADHRRGETRCLSLQARLSSLIVSGPRAGATMQLGFVSAILADFELEEVLAFAGDEGFDCVELMCCPPGAADRRYAGVTHVDVTRLGDDEASRIRDLLAKHGLAVSG